MDTAPFTCRLRGEYSSNTATNLALTVAHGALSWHEPQPPGNVVFAVTIGTEASSSWVETCNGLLTEVTARQQAKRQDFSAIAVSRTRLWLLSGWGCRGRRLSRG